MREIESIKLVLENCESIKIHTKHIGDFSIDDITRSISRLAMNSVSDLTTSDNIHIQVSSEANKTGSFVTSFQDKMPFDRITEHNDITAIEIKYQNNETEYISTNWNSSDRYININQTSTINTHTGDLYIVISTKETV